MERILLIFRVMEAAASNLGPKIGYFVFLEFLQVFRHAVRRHLILYSLQFIIHITHTLRSLPMKFQIKILCESLISLMSVLAPYSDFVSGYCLQIIEKFITI